MLVKRHKHKWQDGCKVTRILLVVKQKSFLTRWTPRNPSRLKGYVEVAGKKADVVIANPSGIQCDGCGVINGGAYHADNR